MMSSTAVRLLIGGSLLVLGGAIGIALDRTLHGGAGMPHTIAVTPHIATEAHRDSVVAQLHRVLSLDQGQAAAIDATIHRHQEALEEGWGAVQGTVTAAVDSVHQELERILTPEQWEQFLEWARGRTGGM